METPESFLGSSLSSSDTTVKQHEVSNVFIYRQLSSGTAALLSLPTCLTQGVGDMCRGQGERPWEKAQQVNMPILQALVYKKAVKALSLVSMGYT